MLSSMHCVKTLFNSGIAPPQALPKAYAGFNRLFVSDNFSTASPALLTLHEKPGWRRLSILAYGRQQVLIIG